MESIKESTRFEILNFTKDDLINCRNNVLSEAMLKKIRSQLIVALVSNYFLILVFTGLLLVSCQNKRSFSQQIQPGGDYFYYFSVFGFTSLIIWFLFLLEN